MDESLCWKMQQLADSLLLKMITIARIVLSVIGIVFLKMAAISKNLSEKIRTFNRNLLT